MHYRERYVKEVNVAIVSTENGEHYVWGGNCDGWHLAASPGLSVIQERVPSGSSEVRHVHHRAEQFFYVLNGTATLEVAGAIYVLSPSEGFHVPAGVPHTLSNQHEHTLEFLVISTPPSHGDRVDA
jgi:mannose-6-phosphate isomerase-like protein (cupin superfamily)